MTIVQGCSLLMAVQLCIMYQYVTWQGAWQGPQTTAFPDEWGDSEASDRA